MLRNFNGSLFITLFFSFIAATVIGTLTHELGHYAIAKYYGYHPKINYQSVQWVDTKEQAFMRSTYTKYQDDIRAGKAFPQKEKFDQIRAGNRKNGFWIILGGPLETMLTGTIGLLFLFISRRKFQSSDPLTLLQWILVFMSLFWLRQTANWFTGFWSYLVKNPFIPRGDEFRIALALHLPLWSVITATAVLGAAVLTLVVFKIIPLRQRLTFLLAGLAGGVSGYLLWIVWFGKYIMP
jgi:hypothetical protein